MAQKKDGRTVTLMFEKERDTKNMVKFMEQPEPNTPPVVGALYIAKATAGKSQRLRTTIELFD